MQENGHGLDWATAQLKYTTASVVIEYILHQAAKYMRMGRIHK